MKLNELKARTGDNDVEGAIVDIQPARMFNKFGKEGRVANARLQDETGTVTLTLWNEQIDQVKAGDKVKITKGWVSEWQGELQLSTGKFGTLEVIYPAGSEPPAKPGEATKVKAQPAHEAGRHQEPASAPKPLGPDDVADEEEFTEENFEDR